MLGGIVSFAADQVSNVVRPAAAAAVATSFGFPLALMMVVLGYLVIQGRIDDRDPKLRSAPQSPLETIVPYETDPS